MANPNIQTAYGGEVLDQILVMAATGNQLFEKGLIHMETSIGDKFYIPRLQLSKLLQKRVEMPKSENSKGEFKIDERLLKPEDIMVRRCRRRAGRKDKKGGVRNVSLFVVKNFEAYSTVETSFSN